ncbi:MAG: CRTAC1 family protein, partial [Phycisphaerae bacterium]
ATAALGDGKGGFRAVADSAKLPPTEIHIGADLDGDGRVDLQMTHGDGGGRWYRSASVAGSPIFDATSVIAPQGRENALIDIDRDGHLDWIHEDAREKRVVFELGDGKGNFRKSGGFETFKEASVIPIDLDGDRQIDFIVKQCGYHNEKIGQSRIMMNDSKGQFTDRTEGAGLGTGDGLTIQGVGDLDQDGSPDLICLEKGKTISIYLNDGKGHFKRLDAAITGMEGVRGPAYANWGLAIVTDFDNDGVPDVLMNGRNFLYVLRGTGGGRLACMNKAWNVGDNAWAAVDEGLCFGDIDGDGRLDLVTCAGTDKRKRVAVLRNDLPARRWLRVRPIGAAGNRPAAGAVVRLLEPGTGKLLWHEQVVIASRQTAHSYYSFGATERHFGLADRAAVDVRVEFYPSGKVVTQQGVKADQTIEVRE